MPETSRQLTPRDFELLESLYRDPKTSLQLFHESDAWDHPFQTLGRLQVRLKALHDAGFINRTRYHEATSGSAPFYYKLTLAGFNAVFGPDAILPTKRFLGPLSPTREPHARLLAECNIHTFRVAKQMGVAVRNFHPDGAYVARLTQDTDAEPDRKDRRESIIPDTVFDLIPPSGNTWTIMQELDRSTEPKTAKVERNRSWAETIRRYERLHYMLDDLGIKFRVFLFFTESWTRCRNVLELAGSVVKNRRRRIYYGIYLPDYLASRDPLQSAIFLDQNLEPAAMLPEREFVKTDSNDIVIAPMSADQYATPPVRQTVAAA